MKRTTTVSAVALLGLLIGQSLAAAVDKPNRIIIYADDRGYGDVSALK